MLVTYIFIVGARGGEFVRETALQAGRSRFRLQIVSLEFFFDNFRSHYGPEFNSASKGGRA